MNHLAKHCNCSQHFKNIVAGSATVEFSGLVYVAKGSHEVNSTQLNNNLMFSDAARVLSRPQLRIDADDVQCDHEHHWPIKSSKFITYVHEVFQRMRRDCY